MAKRKSPYSSTRYKKVKSNIEDVMSKKTSSISNNDLSSKIGNYEKRLSNIGVNTEEAKDTRNAVEKFFNVQQDQNVLFDIFEVLGRPQQALFGGIESVQQGGDFWEGAKENWKGDDYTYGGDLLRNLGVSDEHLFTNPLNQDSVSVADLGGLALDIFADPIDIPIIGEIADIGKAVDVARAADTITDAAKIADTASDVAKTRLAFKPLARDSKSLLELGVGAGAKAGKKVIGATDNLITKGLTKSDAKALQKLIDAGEDVTNFVGKSDAYKILKKSGQRTLDYASSIPKNLYSKITKSDNALDAANAFGKSYSNSLKESVKKYAKKAGRNADDISSDMQKLISSKYAPDESFSNFIKRAVTKKTNTFKGTADEVKLIKDQVDLFKEANNITNDVLNVVIGNGGTSLKVTTKGKNASKKLGTLIGNNELMNELSNIKLVKQTALSSDDLADIARIQGIYDNDATFRKIVDEAEEGYNAVNEMVRHYTGESVSFEDMLRKGYVTNSLTDEGKQFLKELKANKVNVGNKTTRLMSKDDILKGTTKTTSEKTYSNYADQANREFASDVNKAIESKKATIAKEKSYLVKNKIKKVEESLANLNISKKAAKENFLKNITKYTKSKDKYTQLAKFYNDKIYEVSEIVTDDIIKQAYKINDEKIVKGLLTKTTKYTNKANEVTNILAELSKPNLTYKKVASLETRLTKAYDALNSSKIELLIQTEKLTGGATEKYIKEASKVADKVYKNTSKYTEKALKANKKVSENIDKIKKVQSSYADVTNQLKRQQANLQLDLKTLKEKSIDAIKKEDKIHLDKIASLQKDIDLLSSFEGKKLFSSDFFSGFGDFVDKTTKEAKALNNYREVLLHAGLNDENVIKFMQKGEKAGKVPGFVKLRDDDVAQLSNYLDNMKNFLPEDSKLIKEFKNQISNSKSIYIEKGLNDLLKINVSEKEINPLVNMLNKYNNFFKKYSTLTPGFHLRNIAGNTTNMIMSGVPASQVPILYAKANKLASSKYIMDIVTKKGTGVLTAAEEADYKIIKQFLEGGFAGTGKDIRDLGEVFAKATTDNKSKNILKKFLDKTFELNVKGNEFVDARNRMALLSYANNNPGYIRKLGAKDAIDATKKVLFDAKNLSPFEQKYLKQVIPFYTFTKQNLVFQANNLIANTSKYKRLFKTFNETYDAVGKENYRQYQKENFEIPLFMGDEGLTTIKANLPVSDLGEYMSDPLGRLVSSTNPLIKTPFELNSGVDTFTGQDISDRSGLETLARSLGLTNIYNTVGNIADLASGETEITPATITPSIFRYTDAEKLANQREYEELIQYQQIVKDLKNQGIDVPTINELANSTNATIKAVKKRREEILKRRS